MSTPVAAKPTEQTRDSYYGQAVIKPPVWTREIPWYLFTGGLGGASAGLAYMGERRGDAVLAQRAWICALAGVSASPALLISDLGVPSRFLNMMRMLKVTSPMSVGSWILALSGMMTAAAATNALTGLLPHVARVAKPAAGALGMPLSTYTGALIAQTSVPAWHGARRELPALFAAGAAASAGAAAVLATPVKHAAPARRLALIGSAAEVIVSEAMEQRLGELAEPYGSGPAGAYSHAARGFTVAGSLVVASAGRRRRAAAIAGGAMVLAGAVCERFAVFKAGFASARDPRFTVKPQRERVM